MKKYSIKDLMNEYKAYKEIQGDGITLAIDFINYLYEKEQDDTYLEDNENSDERDIPGIYDREEEN